MIPFSRINGTIPIANEAEFVKATVNLSRIRHHIKKQESASELLEVGQRLLGRMGEYLNQLALSAEQSAPMVSHGQRDAGAADTEDYAPREPMVLHRAGPVLPLLHKPVYDESDSPETKLEKIRGYITENPDDAGRFQSEVQVLRVVCHHQADESGQA
jgi:hypothetical protein